MHRKLWRCAKMHFCALAYFEEVGHSTKCCHLVTNNFFGSNFFRTLIRACTGSFENVWTGANLENIKLGQIFGSSKNGSWALVDACNFFFCGSWIRACTGSFGYLPKCKNIKNTHKGWLYSKNVNCRFVPNGILGNLLMTLIDLVN